MKSCPQCGKPENEISMTTGLDVNKAFCSCGWTGNVDDLKDDKPAKKAKTVETEPTEEAAK